MNKERILILLFTVVISILLLSSCNSKDNKQSQNTDSAIGIEPTQKHSKPPTQSITVLKVKADFENDDMEFVGGVADVPVDHGDYNVVTEFAQIPDIESRGYKLSGNNHSDDMFLYTYLEIDAMPNTMYRADLAFDFATSIPAGMMGVGGSPGASIYVKAGVIDQMPQVLVDDTLLEAYLRMNIDHGSQSNSGTDMKVVGNAEKPEDQTDDRFILKPFEYSTEVIAGTDGKLYLIIGLDSGFEGIMEFYIDNINLTLTPIS